MRGALVQGFTAADLARQEVVAVTTATADALDLRTGDLARLQIAGRTRTVGIVIIGRREIGALTDAAIALAPLAYLQRLTGLEHRVSRVLVEARPGQVEAVRRRLGRVAGERLDVRTAEYEPQLFDKTSQSVSQATLISSTLSALVGFMFAACAMLVTVAARRALAIDLRRSGFDTRQIASVLLIDALVIGLSAVALGLLLGDVMSRRGFSANASFLEGAFPIGDERIVTWSSVAVAVFGGLLAAAIGVLAPLRREVFGTGHVDRAAAARRRERTMTNGRIAGVVGVGLLAASIAITAFAPGAVIVGLIALTVSVALLVPVALDTVLVTSRWATRRVTRTIMPVELALPQLESPTWRVRSLAIVATGALAVFGGAASFGARVNLQDGLDRAATVEYDHTADVWISPYGPGDLFAVTPIPQSAVAQRVARLPVVQRVGLYRGSYLDVERNRAWVRAPDRGSRGPIPTAQILDGSAGQATARFRSGGWATLSRALADALHVDVGERFVLPSPSPTTFRLAAITTNLGLPGGAVILNSDDYARAWGSDAVSAYQVMLEPGVSPDRGRAEIQRVVGAGSALRVETAAQRDDREMAASRAVLSRFRQVASLTLIAAIIAMASAMAGLLWQQRSSVSRQKLDGHRTVVMWRALAVESGVLFVTGCLLGAVASLLGQVLFSRGLQTISGFPVTIGVQAGVSAATFALVTAIALIVVAAPGYLVARVPPSLRTSD